MKRREKETPTQDSDLIKLKIKTSGLSNNMYLIKIRSYVHLQRQRIRNN